jgi:uncharacterized metal-binding protein YceD (DUF177 family)
VKGFSVNFVGLSNKAHPFEFKLDDSFFERYGTEILTSGNLDAVVVLDKHETFIEADFTIKGTVRLTCDRSLEPFDEILDLQKKVVFKFGDNPGEVSDEIIIVSREETSLELGQLMYEFIVIAIPIKKLHPRFRAEEAEQPETEGKIVYRGTTEEQGDIDPRWEALKKLK